MMHSLKVLPAALALGAAALAASAQAPTNPRELVDKIAAEERAQAQLLRQYSPLVETYIQYLRPDNSSKIVPHGDRYFLGRAELAKGVELYPLGRATRISHKLRGVFSTEFVPRGFLQMIYLDMSGFDRAHYRIEYVRREFLGEVRCLVFDVDPLPKSGKGRFVGRIWVEDQDYHIVRFNGAYGGSSLVSNYFNFDSWRTNVGKNLWLPTFIYVEEGSVNDKNTKNIGYKAFRAQTRLWGYNLGPTRREQELSKVLVEPSTGIRDQVENTNDYTPLQAERYWDQMAAENILERLEHQGLLAPKGEVNKILETVVNNIRVTNNLDGETGVQCRVLMTSTLESLTIGHTIVLSRGLIDVLPDEPTLAAILAHELGHVVLGHRLNGQFGFFDFLRASDEETFRKFDFTRTPEEEQAANQKGLELLKNSPYGQSRGAAPLFFEALRGRSKQIPNLITPSLGDNVLAGWAKAYAASSAGLNENPSTNVIVALPLGGRIKIDPWDDQLRMLESKPVGAVAESEKMPFQITRFFLYLTREKNTSAGIPNAVAAKVPDGSK